MRGDSASGAGRMYGRCSQSRAASAASSRFWRYLDERDGWLAVPWDDSWPALPLTEGGREFRREFLQALYAFAGGRPDVLQHIPCFCGCRLQGHHSVHDCYVAHRSAQRNVTDWNSHGAMCPFAPDISGDVMVRHHNGTPLAQIREQIDDEFGGRGTPTPTPYPTAD